MKKFEGRVTPQTQPSFLTWVVILLWILNDIEHYKEQVHGALSIEGLHHYLETLKEHPTIRVQLRWSDPEYSLLKVSERGKASARRS